MHFVAAVVYLLCAATAGACAFLLLRAYSRQRVALLLWSGLCFVGLTLNNVALIADRLIFPGMDLWLMRALPAVLGIGALLYGLIFEVDR